MAEAVELMSTDYGWSSSPSNLSNKLAGGTLQYPEACQLADNTKSVLEGLQKKQRLLEQEEKERLLTNIPLEIIEKYNKNHKEENTLEA